MPVLCGTGRREWGGRETGNTGDPEGIIPARLKSVIESKCNRCYISMKTWLLLHYTLPSHPSARRVYIWRKLKGLGAILLNESVWVLPDLPRTAEQVQWLTAEIQEMEGDAYMWRSTLFMKTRQDALIRQ